MRRPLLLFATLSLAAQARGQCPDGSPPPCLRPSHATSAVSSPNSVAVLYFENLGRDTSDVYIADGLTEEVTARLGQIGRLNVVSRTAIRRLRGAATMQTAELGRALNVSYLVNGSIRRAGDKLRVTVELVRASSGGRAWGDQYDRNMADLLAIQEDIARSVATGIAGQLLPGERASIAKRPTRSAEAYDHYLRGARNFDIINPSSLGRAIGEFEAALRLDPRFTAARAFIAMAYAFSINWNWATPELPFDTLLARGLAASSQAIREDSTSSDAWLSRGVLLSFARPVTFEGSIEALSRAIALRPDNAFAYQWRGILERRLGRFDAAIADFHRSAQLDPGSVQNMSDLGFLAYMRRNHREAIQWLDSALAMDSTRWQDYLYRPRALLAAGDTAAALRDARLGAQKSGGQRIALALLSNIEARSGITTGVRERLDPLVEFYRGRKDIPVRDGYEIAAALVAVGDTSRALDVLERTSPKGAWLWSYLYFLDFDPVRDNPRFQRVFAASTPPGAPPVPRDR